MFFTNSCICYMDIFVIFSTSSMHALCVGGSCCWHHAVNLLYLFGSIFLCIFYFISSFFSFPLHPMFPSSRSLLGSLFIFLRWHVFFYLHGFFSSWNLLPSSVLGYEPSLRTGPYFDWRLWTNICYFKSKCNALNFYALIF